MMVMRFCKVRGCGIVVESRIAVCPSCRIAGGYGALLAAIVGGLLKMAGLL